LSTIHYHHIKQLPLSIFIEVLCDENYSLLGTASEQALQENWELLMEQFNEAVGGVDTTARLNNIKKILLLESKINRAKKLIKLLELQPDEWSYNQLFTFGYLVPNFKYSIDNIPKVLEVFEGYLKRDFFQYETLIKEHNENANKEEIKKPKREDFINMIVALTKHFGVAINQEKTSVETYCAYVRNYQKEIDILIMV